MYFCFDLSRIDEESLLCSRNNSQCTSDDDDGNDDGDNDGDDDGGDDDDDNSQCTSDDDDGEGQEYCPAHNLLLKFSCSKFESYRRSIG